MSASAVRAGKAFVEITANDTEFQRGMKRVQHSVVRMGSLMKTLGTNLLTAGGAMGLPMVLAARSAATFEDALLELEGAAGNLADGDLRRVRAEALRLSAALGVAPASVAQAFALLVKAGMPLEEALQGGAKAAVEFARVSGVEATQAAEFMSDAMKVFDVSADEAADTLSAAADSSSTSIASMVESFALVASVAKGTGQTLFGISQGFAALAQYGIKGEEAGTGIKTLLLKLVAPSNEAKEALATLGISMGELVDKSGTLLPLAQLASVFRKAMAGMDRGAREAMLANEALVKVFDVRGIRVIQAFADIGEDGFNNLATAMETSRTVSEKFGIAMSGISGSFSILVSSVQRLAVAFATGLGPSLSMVAWLAAGFIDRIAWILEKVPFVAPVLAAAATAMVVLGGVAFGCSVMLNLMSWSIRGVVGLREAWVTVMTAMTGANTLFAASVSGINKALLLMRARIYAIPGWGWLLAALAVAGGALAWAFSGSDTKAKPKKSGVKRDKEREALGGADAGAMAAAGPKSRGEALGTFSASIAAQLGIGPALTAQEQTADNTGRMADGVDALVRQGEDRVPGAAALQAGMAPPGVRGGVAARSDRDLVSMSERAAIAAEESRGYLRQLVEKARNGGLAFA